ncbi:MAG: glycosyltransferase family 2 protein [Chloroflexota bacterium]
MANAALRGVWVVLFWVALAGILYTYVGYPALIALLARWRPRPVRQADITPTVTLLIAAYNEEACIAQKLDNSLALDYPADRLEIAVVADGSNDGTCDITREYVRRSPVGGPPVRLLWEPERRGKPAALIRAFPLTQGEVVVFSDANSYFTPEALRKLVRHFADPEVGGASGAKRVVAQGQGAASHGEGLYWRYEAFIKACESAVSSVMGVPGEIWAARRAAYVHSESNSLIEDFVASLRMVAAGWRIVYEPEAWAYEEGSASLRAEWIRRTRMAAGGWQSFFQLPGMLRHPNNLLTWQYLSHRMLRWMVTPSLFVLLLLANLPLARAPFYALALAAQALFYALAGLGWLLGGGQRRGQSLGWLLAPFYVCFLNAVALAGGWRYLRGKQSVVWRKAR